MDSGSWITRHKTNNSHLLLMRPCILRVADRGSALRTSLTLSARQQASQLAADQFVSGRPWGRLMLSTADTPTCHEANRQAYRIVMCVKIRNRSARPQHHAIAKRIVRKSDVQGGWLWPLRLVRWSA